MIRLECPCGRTAEVPESMAGKKGLCQSCGKTLVVPYPKKAAPKAAAAKPAPPPPAAPRAGDKKNIGVGLDKECERCGELVSYAYKSPVPGLCGKCADREMAERRRRARGKMVKRNVGGFEVEDWVEAQRPWKSVAVGVLLLILAGVLFILWKTGRIQIPGL